MTVQSNNAQAQPPAPIEPAHNDRSKARYLTVQELRESWDPLIGKLDLEDKLVVSQLGEEMLASYLKNESSSTSVAKSGKTTDLQYPPMRIDYLPLTNEQLGFKQSQRAFKLLLFKEILGFAADAYIFEEKLIVGEVGFRKIWDAAQSKFAVKDTAGQDGEGGSARLERESPLKTVDECLQEAEKRKKVANDLFNQGDHPLAIYHYVKAWFEIYPYHLDAFPVGHPSRNGIAAMEVNLFNNMMASLMAMADKPRSDEPREMKGEYYLMAMKCARACMMQTFGFSVKGMKRFMKRFKIIQEGFAEFRPGSELTLLLYGPMMELWKRDMEGKDDDDMMFENDNMGSMGAMSLLGRMGNGAWGMKD
ncbi:hypothetical protein I317_05107 [Kwoniella heveanensis CBS 569]|nr:hypothetical protein I317_05107 [Kwoniella heveanensis CBS 569]